MQPSCSATSRTPTAAAPPRSTGEPTRHSCVAFGTLGEHLADSLGKGDRILVVGDVVTDAWEDKDTGDKRTAQRILVDAAGPSLRWAAATIRKAQRTTTPPGQGE